MAASASRNGASWDFPRSAVASLQLLETAESHGVDAATVLAGTGLTATQLADPSIEIQAAQELTIARNLLRHVDDPTGLGLETGLRASLANTGILGYAFLTSPTIRDAITLGVRFAALSSTFLDVSMHESAEGLVLELDTSQIPSDVRVFLVQRDLTAIAHIAPLLLGANIPGARLRFATGEIAIPLELLEATGLEFTVDESSPGTALTIPNELLDQPMPAADSDTAAMCIAQCEELLDRRRHRGGFSAQLRTRLLDDPAQMPSMAAIAREFAVTERTLHRRLAAENTSFRALVDEVRETLAVELLGAGLGVEEVASRLGYSETAAFTHAFVRWRGHPPSRLNRGQSGSVK
ncbi:AraC family transcriptional regulator [Mycolicibacterium brisbanense]|uniref:AraC family transcriptional regulator n=1 Tax=Mycolicibacterium brisbanense TaxID=146020 RepID=A0A100VXU0_9MYCO|nr:AraC family transcriptional regulator [Mycolicibacterium brisbanense]MCV7157774.1 AraC family transcriptional regulator ligand-binding domain-containing protein [Mycolicibacterium brisbanense]GAS87991.1 AraC family transcriptional regulator [Mycolicibacterium brisbanense]